MSMLDSQLNGILRSISRGEAEFLPSIVEAMAMATLADAVIVSQLDSKNQQAHTLAFLVDGKIAENFSYQLKHTPCETVFNDSGQSCLYNNNVQECFPLDQDLIDLGARSYFGYPLKDDDGQLVGILVALYRCGIDNLDQLESLFGLFSGLIARELTIVEKNKHLALASSVIENAREAVVVFNRAFEVQFVNPAFTQFTGYTEAEVLGLKISDEKFFSVDSGKVRAILEALREHRRWQGEVASQRKNGERYIQWLQINQDKHKNYICQFSDVTPREDAVQTIQFQANFDTLTLLPNRHLFIDRLSQAIKAFRRHRRSFAIMFMDLDGFKEINDQHGHLMGDKLLGNVSQRLKKRLRASDTIARYGGDEFIFLLESGDNNYSPESLANSLCESIAQAYEIDGAVLNISASIGIACYPQHGDNAEQLIASADAAMYQAKQKGKNQYCVSGRLNQP